MQFVDAHCHLQFERIASLTSIILKESISKGITHFVVNATSPEDFDRVIQIQNQYQHITPCFGIHPYYIKESQNEEYHERLYSKCKEMNCNYCIGEIGMDKTITSTISMQLQETMFRKQIQFAISQSVPFIVHCVRCIGSVYQVLQDEVKQPYPFLMHGYSGSADFVPKLVKLGAYFSISNYFLNLSPNRRKAMEDTIKQIPLDRLLFESDAPDMICRDSISTQTLLDNQQKPVNTPICILKICKEVAKIKSISPEQLAQVVYSNSMSFFHLFLVC